MKMRKSNRNPNRFQVGKNILALLIVSFIVVSLFGFSIIWSKIQAMKQVTGKATTVTATVNVTVNATEKPRPPASGAGASGARAVGRNFFIDPESLEVEAVVYISKEVDLLITNRGYLTEKYTLTTNLPIIGFSPSAFILKQGLSKIVKVRVMATMPGLYTGTITVKTSVMSWEVPVIVKVESDARFKVEIEIPREFKIVRPGSELLVRVSIQDLNGEADVAYFIKDAANHVLNRQVERVEVDDEITFDKVIKLMQNIKEGDYVVGMELDYYGKTKVAYDTFTVAKQVPEFEEPAKFAAARAEAKGRGQFMLVILLLIIIFLHLWFFKKARKYDRMEKFKS